MIKLIATDVDGTLIKDGTLEINPEYFQVIRQLQAKGIKFVVCSGRGYGSLEKLFAPIKDEILFVCDGGAVARDSKETFFVNSLDEEVWKGIYRDVKKNPELECFICTPDDNFAEDPNSEMYIYLEKSYGFKMDVVEDLLTVSRPDIIKLAIFNPTKCNELCSEHIIPAWSDRSHIACSGVRWVDCIAKETHKGTGLSYLLNKYDIAPEDICVFGDNYNDIEMFQLAGRSFAVSNTHSQVIASATDTCAPYWEDGVLAVLKTFL